MARQNEINAKMRAILIDWLLEVAAKFKLGMLIAYRTVDFLDRFISQHTVKRSELQLVGITCMLLASKMGSTEDGSIPTVGDFAYICDKAYTIDQILAMEQTIALAFEFDMTDKTPFPEPNERLDAMRTILLFSIDRFSHHSPEHEIQRMIQDKRYKPTSCVLQQWAQLHKEHAKRKGVTMWHSDQVLREIAPTMG